ncbi:MAG TPA: hypothetical protein VGN76_08330 [Gemmatimonadales bacterium]|jgi:hypothetical protein|nr:hypothetical protein [Gemmatimonadales bacterium]
MVNVDSMRLAERVRTALVQSALDAYEDASVRGLCCEGAWEAAVSAMRHHDLNLVLTEPITEPGD